MSRQGPQLRIAHTCLMPGQQCLHPQGVVVCSGAWGRRRGGRVELLQPRKVCTTYVLGREGTNKGCRRQAWERGLSGSRDLPLCIHTRACVSACMYVCVSQPGPGALPKCGRGDCMNLHLMHNLYWALPPGAVVLYGGISNTSCRRVVQALCLPACLLA
jgi:hypothetical protein